MTLSRMEHSGNAAPTTLATGVTPSSTSIAATVGTGFPTGAVGPFVIVIDPDVPGEEKILCSARSTGTFTVATSGRGYDGTVAAAHSAGAIIKHVWTANEADDISSHVYDPTRDDHAGYLNAARHDVTARHAFGAALGTPAAATASSPGDTAAAGSAATPARADHRHAREAAAGLPSYGAGLSSSVPPGQTAADGSSTLLARADHAHSRSTSETFATLSSGLTGATAATRWVGATASGAPSSGSFLVGDFVIDQTGYVFICTTAGSPGTWVSSRPMVPSDNTVATLQTTTSTTYTDLATVGPTVSIVTGTTAMVTVVATLFNSTTAGSALMSYAVSGASSEVASDLYAVNAGEGTGGGNFGVQACNRMRVFGLTPGVNVFTAKYRINAVGTATFLNRYLLVEPL